MMTKTIAPLPTVAVWNSRMWNPDEFVWIWGAGGCGTSSLELEPPTICYLIQKNNSPMVDNNSFRMIAME